MSVRTSTVAVPGRTARRVQAAERVKSGAAQRAYARKRTRQQLLDGISLPDRSSTMAGRIPFVTAIIGLLGCGLALTLLLTTRAAEDSYLLGDMRADNRTLADERAALQREVAAADSAPELAARARELGMIPAKDPARLVIGPGGEVTVIGTPTPAQGAPAPPLNGPPTTTQNPAPGQQAQGERVVPVQPGTPATDPAAPNSTPPALLAAPGGQAGAPSAPVVNPAQAQPDSPQGLPGPQTQVEPPAGEGVPPAPSESPVQAPAPQLVPDRVEVAAAPADTPPPAPDVAPLPDAGPPSETPQIVAPEAGR
ncbi:hypothetical protein [Nocardia sp. GTS18]|uniref:hypothetical protein n=1 Tax=Nocardia sp. GTS18 TaxID=1778064 RepID=UPI0021079B58|nr:hypothetical protein [Nocardia sp. GTS18]